MKYFLYISLIGLVIYGVYAYPSYVQNIPNGSVNSCANCHVGGTSSGNYTPFATHMGQYNFTWSATVAALDSDNDGASNGLELQDVQGTWTKGSPAPGNASLVTNPGDPTDTPTNVDDATNYIKLMSVNPNPAVDDVIVEMNLVTPQRIQLDLYDNSGKKLAQLFDGYVENLEFKHPFSLSSASGAKMISGTYFVKATINGVTQTAKFVVAE